MQARNVELTALIAIGAALALAAWHAASQRIEPAPAAVPHANLLVCSAAELRSALSEALEDPDLSTVQEGVSRARNELTNKQRRDATLAGLLRASGAKQLLTPTQYRALRPRLIVREPADARRHWFLHVALLVGAFLAVHLILRFSRFQGSGVFLPLSLILCGTAAVLLFTFTDPLRDRLLYPGFVTGAAIGCAVLVAAARLVRLHTLAEFRYLAILAALGLSVLLVVLGTGPHGTDARINLFGIFQPVEYIKLLVVLFLASYFAGKDIELRRLDAARWLVFSLPRWRDVLPVVVFVAASLALFFLQKDLGPALILYLVFLGLFVTASRRFVLGLAGLGVLVSAFAVAYRFKLLETVSTRIEMWLSPWDNHRPGGVQLAESLWALAAGGFSGSGLARAHPGIHPGRPHRSGIGRDRRIVGLTRPARGAGRVGRTGCRYRALCLARPGPVRSLPGFRARTAHRRSDRRDCRRHVWPDPADGGSRSIPQLR